VRALTVEDIHELIKARLLLQEQLWRYGRRERSVRPVLREISNSRHNTDIFSPSINRATNRSLSSILEHSCHGICVTPTRRRLSQKSGEEITVTTSF
jgi:hypothetical protein